MRRKTAAVLVAVAMLCVGYGGGRSWFPAVAVAAEEKPVGVAGQAAKQPDDAEAVKRKTAAQLLAAAAEAVSLMGEKQRQANAYLWVANDQLKIGDIAAARHTLRKAKAVAEFKEKEEQPETYGFIAEAQARANDFPEARDTIERAKLSGVISNYAGQRIVEAQLAVGDFAGAKATAANLGPDDRGKAYANITAAEAKAVKASAGKPAVAEAADLFQRKLTRSQLESEINKLGGASQETYALLVQAQLEEGDFAGAKATAAKMRIFAGAWSYRDIAGAQAEAGDFAGAEATAKLIADPSPLMSCYIAIARAQAEAGHAAGARKSLEKAKRAVSQIEAAEAKSGKFPADSQCAYHDIAIAQAQTGDTEGATTTLIQITRESLRATVYLALAQAHAKAAEAAPAYEAVEKARVLAPHIVDEQDRQYTYHDLAMVPASLAEAQAKAGDVAGAEKTAAAIESESTRLVAYRMIGVVQAERGDLPRARQTFDSAKAVASRLQNARDRGSAYHTIAAAQAKAGEMSAARQTFKEAMAAVVQISDRLEREEACFYVALKQVRVGDVAGAMESVAAGSEPFNRHWLLVRLAERFYGIEHPYTSFRY